MANLEAAVRTAATTGIGSRITADGGNAEKVFHDAGLPTGKARDPQRWIPLEQYRRLLVLATEETGDERIGLQVGSSFDLRNYGILGYATLNCPTLGEAMSNVVRYFAVMRKGARFSLDVTNETASVTFQTLTGPAAIPRPEAELAVARVCAGIRALVGSDWAPCETHFAHDGPSDKGDYESFFRSPVRFRMDANRLLLKRRDFTRRNEAADRRLYEILRLRLEDLLPQEDSDDLVGKVRQEVARQLSEGAPLDDVAKRIGVGARTLQRRLRDRGLGFNAIVDEVRRERSFLYLQREDLTVSEIAFRLGYSEASSFDRAFRRWSGTSPLQFRRGGAASLRAGTV